MGLSPETLIRFVYDLYKDYSNERIVPPEEVARLSWESVPGVLIRTDTSDME